MQIVAESEQGAIVVYKALQRLPGQQNTLRFVFELHQNGDVIWRHLHENALSQL